MSGDSIITRSSGNVFADAGVPDADTHLVKAGLVSAWTRSSANVA